MKKFLLGLLLLPTFAFADPANIRLDWEHTTIKQNGEPIAGELLYHIKAFHNDVELPEIVVQGSDNTVTINDVSAGTYVFQIAASEDGLMSDYSSPVSVVLGEIEPEVSLPTIPALRIILECNDCQLEVR